MGVHVLFQALIQALIQFQSSMADSLICSLKLSLVNKLLQKCDVKAWDRAQVYRRLTRNHSGCVCVSGAELESESFNSGVVVEHLHADGVSERVHRSSHATVSSGHICPDHWGESWSSHHVQQKLRPHPYLGPELSTPSQLLNQILRRMLGWWGGS